MAIVSEKLRLLYYSVILIYGKDRVSPPLVPRQGPE
jgi:hypothetical protein